MPSRRTLLTSSAALATALAGCADLGNDSGDGSDTPDGDGTTTPGGTVDDDPLGWLPAPASGTTASFTANDIERVYELADLVEAYDPGRMPPVRYAPAPVGIDRSALAYAVHTNWSFQQAVRAEFDRAAAESRLDENGTYERAETTAGFALYAGGQVDVAVGDGRICWSASNLDDGVDPTLTAAVEAKAGDGDRALATNDRLASLVDRLGTGLEYGGEAAAEGTLDTDLPGPLIAYGGRTALDGERVTVERHLVYDGADDVPDDDARDDLLADLAETTQPLSAADLTAEVDGDALVVSGTIEASAWVEALGGGGTATTAGE